MLNNSYITEPTLPNISNIRIAGFFILAVLFMLLVGLTIALISLWIRTNDAKRNLQTIKDCFIFLNKENKAVLLVDGFVSKQTVLEACDTQKVDDRYKNLFINFFEMFEAEANSILLLPMLLTTKPKFQESFKFLKDGLIELIAEDFEDFGIPSDFSSFPIAIHKDLRKVVKELRLNKRENDSLEMLRMKLNGSTPDELLAEMLKRNYHVSESTLLKGQKG